MQAVWTWQRGYAMVLGTALGMAALGDWLFYERSVGISAAVFAGVLWVAMAVRKGASWRAAFVLALMIPLWIEPTNLSVLLAGFGVIAMALRTQTYLTWQQTAQRWIRFVFAGWAQAIWDSAIVVKWRALHPYASRKRNWVIVAWVMPIILSSVFILLFSMANPIIEEWINRAIANVEMLLDWIPNIFSPGRTILWLSILAGTWMLLRGRVKGRLSKKKLAAPFVVTVAPERAIFGRAAIARCLLLFNLIFALQTALDGFYLWGHESLPKGMSYSEYAHRGAYPLMATALLAGLFVLITFRPGSRSESSRFCRALVYLWIAQNVMLLVSAVLRLKLYVSVWDLTRLRVAAAIWMGLVALGFVWIVIRIIKSKSNEWLISMNVGTLAIVLYVCCFLNIDRMIAEYNVKHSAEAGVVGHHGLGVNYLDWLGVDALPAMRWLRENSNVNLDHLGLDQRIARLEGELREDLSDWRSWTIRRRELALAGKERMSKKLNTYFSRLAGG